MEQPIPAWLTDAVNAAALATVYNADDWSRLVDEQIKQAADSGPEFPPMPH